MRAGYREFGFSLLVAMGFGFVLHVVGKRSDNQVNRRDGFVIVRLRGFFFP